MIVVNKTREKIWSHHRRGGPFLKPGTNDIEDASLSKSEREMLVALEKHKLVEITEPPPESGAQVIATPDAVAEPPAPKPKPKPMKQRRAKKKQR